MVAACNVGTPVEADEWTMSNIFDVAVEQREF